MSERIDFNVSRLDENLPIIFAMYAMAYKDETNGYSTRKGKLTKSFRKWVSGSEKGKIFLEAIDKHLKKMEEMKK